MTTTQTGGAAPLAEVRGSGVTPATTPAASSPFAAPEATSPASGAAEGQRRKEIGQAASLFTLNLVHRLNFEAILKTAPATFSINDIRDAMDRLMIPDKARGGLFAGAVAARLIRPLYVQGYPCRVPSTGVSAHSATVVVYERLTP
jgi:hypothetical protein